jgi:hypothetical protein
MRGHAQNLGEHCWLFWKNVRLSSQVAGYHKRFKYSNAEFEELQNATGGLRGHHDLIVCQSERHLWASPKFCLGPYMYTRHSRDGKSEIL